MSARILKLLWILGSAVFAACSATTNITAPQQEVAVRVREKSFPVLPANDEISTTTFGNYEFKAEKAGAEPFYGNLPLKFNGGYLALDILFFAPAMFFNLRGVFPQYEIDVEQRLIRYRKSDVAPWTEYKPTPAEAERSQRFFGDLH